jgi:hypothetical protein
MFEGMTHLRLVKVKAASIASLATSILLMAAPAPVHAQTGVIPVYSCNWYGCNIGYSAYIGIAGFGSGGGSSVD